jgi:Flp pilus assembly protein CpaB
VKKKTPPYAIIFAALLGIVAIVALVQWKKGQDAAHQAELDKIKADNAAALAAAQANKPAPEAPPPTDMRNVYYATQPVEAGAKISSAFYEKKPTPNSILPDAFTDATDIVGFYAVRNIEKGDPLTPRNIGKSLPFLSERIKPGMRALSLEIFNAGEYNKTGGFVVDGDRVDLLYSINTLKDDLKINTQTVMQNVDVLYVPGPKVESEEMNGIQPAPSPGGGMAVTFEVSPEQAQALIFMSNVKNAKFSMILRSRRDTEELKHLKPFDVRDYDILNLKKVQKMVDKSNDRVADLAKEIESKEKAMANPGNTNETPNPTPPSP